MKRLVLMMFAALLLCGCVSSRRGVARERPSWTVGRTTARDVVARWGNPDFIHGDEWVWWNVQSIGGKFRVAYMGVGFTVSNSRRDMCECRLRFDASGRLAEMSVTETQPGGAQWSLCPFD